MADDTDNAARADAPAEKQEAGGGESPGSSPAGRRCLLPGPAATVALRDVLEPTLAAAMRRRLAADWGVHLVDVSLTSAQGFHRNVQEPTCCYTLTVRPSRASGDAAGQVCACLWVDVGAEIAHPILDVLLGGPGGRGPPNDRPLTALERRLLRRLPEAVGECFSPSLARAGLSVRLANGPGSAASAGAAEMAVLTFRLSGRRADGAMRVCLPPALLEAVLPAGASQLGHWAAIELSAALPDTSLPASEAAGLAVGDILATDTPADGEVTVRLAGVAKFAARLGACNGNRAITITRPLPPPQPD